MAARRWLVLGLLAAACLPAKRATMEQLVARSSFDLACPAAELRLYHFGEAAKGVAGCGRRVTYVERCETDACAWVLDSPANDQLAWPTTPSQPAVAPVAAPVAVPAATPWPSPQPVPRPVAPPVSATMRPPPPDWGF
jgi:hypothetical protein